MKKILNYWTNLAIISIIILAGGLSSCSDDDNDDKETPDNNTDRELVNQIRYNTDVSDIRSVVWERNASGVYSIYLSSKESVNSVEELGTDYMKIDAKNISDFSTQTDTYSLSFREISVDEKSVSNGKAKVDLDFKLDLKAAIFDIKGNIRVNDSENTLSIKYNGPARRLMPQVTENQINYNGEKHELKASAWKRSSDGMYTFYVSSEDITDVENISGSYITIETMNPLNFDAAKDAFSIKYGDIVLNENSIKEGYTKLDVKIGFDPVTATFAVSSEAHTEKGDVFMASYSGRSAHIRPQAEDSKIILNDETSNINSAIWETADDGSYHIYLSPRKGLTSYEEMVKTDDYMLIKTAKAEGAVKDQYEITFRNVKINAESHYIDSDINIVLKDGRLDMSIYALTNEGVELNASYNGNAEMISPIQLHNQWQTDREDVKTIGSAIEWRTGDLVSFYLCHEKGLNSIDDIKGSENIRIVVPKGYSENIDLNNKDVKIILGSINSENAKNVKGSLRISKNDLHKSIKIVLDAEIDGRHIRADWTGKYSVGYDSCNKLRIVTPDERVSEVILSTVFMHTNGVTNSIAFGTKDNPKDVKDLMEGLAVQLNLTNLMQDTDLASSTDYRIRLFDYAKYETYDSSKSKTKGILNVWNNGAGMIYFMLDASINNVKVKAEWYGKVTMVNDFDIVPVRPFHPYFMITQKDGEVTKDMEITELQVRDEPNFQSNITGARFNAYVFYFVNKYTAGAGVNDISATPVLAVNKDYVNKGEIDITKGEKIFDFQYLPFNSPGIASPVGNGTTTEKGSLMVTREREKWTIKFSVYDYGDWWGYGQSSGTKATFTAEWKGVGSNYSGK